MRLASRQLRTLAGRSEERLAGFTTSLLDVIRMASSAIEWYPQVSVGPVVELAVLGYAADDVATLMSALLDNATRYSPGTVTVSCHLLEEGGALLRIEDTGIGIGRGRVARLNAVFAGPVPEVDKSTGRHTGFPVVHRIARKHSIGVRFASRRAPGTGTVAMVILPPQLLCAIPAEATPPLLPPSGQRRSRGERGSRSAQPGRTALMQTASMPIAPMQAESAAGRVVGGHRRAPPPEAVLPEPVPSRLPPEPLDRAGAAGGCCRRPAPPVIALPEPRLAGGRRSPEPCRRGGVAGAGPGPSRPVASCRAGSRPSCRGDDQPRPAPTSHHASATAASQQAAARRAFADELGAFSRGIHDALAARGITGGVVRATTDSAPIEEGAQA